MGRGGIRTIYVGVKEKGGVWCSGGLPQLLLLAVYIVSREPDWAIRRGSRLVL